MERVTFLRVLKNNLTCAFCKNKTCLVRYYPEKKKTQYYNASKYVTKCEKDQKKHMDKSVKTPLP